MTTLREWLLAPWDVELPFEHDVADLQAGTATRLQVLTALASMDSGGYRFIVGDGSIYGRRGLYQHEAYAWWELRAFVNGWLEGTAGADEVWFKQAIVDERARVEKLFAERKTGEHG